MSESSRLSCGGVSMNVTFGRSWRIIAQCTTHALARLGIARHTFHGTLQHRTPRISQHTIANYITFPVSHARTDPCTVSSTELCIKCLHMLQRHCGLEFVILFKVAKDESCILCRHGRGWARCPLLPRKQLEHIQIQPTWRQWQ